MIESWYNEEMDIIKVDYWQVEYPIHAVPGRDTWNGKLIPVDHDHSLEVLKSLMSGEKYSGF